jgi:DNA-binding response OmpR family regulator
MQIPLRRVLCVDDNEDTCFMLTALLGRSYEAASAGNAHDALELARSEHFDLYVIDTMLGDSSGLDLCRRIRELDAQTPIIFYSGAVYEEDKEEGLRAGAQAYVAKPGINKLLETAARLLENTEG